MWRKVNQCAFGLLGGIVVFCLAGATTIPARVQNKGIGPSLASAVANRGRSGEFAQNRNPRQLARAIRNELNTLPYYSVFDWIEFEVDDNGVVNLRGQVTSPPDTKSTAEAYVRDIEGVTRVVNQIEVLPVSPNDQRLRRALYRAVYSGPLYRYQVGSLQSIHIIVNRGRVTLKGVVDREGDRTIAYVRARSVPGTFEVTNELVVRGEEERRAR